MRDYIVQSQEFILCAVGLIYLVYQRIRERSLLWALALAVLAILFLVNVMFVAPSRTGLVTVPVLLVILVLAHCRWTISVALGCAIIAVAAVAFVASPKIQGRILGIVTEVQDYRTRQKIHIRGRAVRFLDHSARHHQEGAGDRCTAPARSTPAIFARRTSAVRARPADHQSA